MVTATCGCTTCAWRPSSAWSSSLTSTPPGCAEPRSSSSFLSCSLGHLSFHYLSISTCYFAVSLPYLLSKVVNVHINPDGMNCLITGSRVGDLLWWDQRFPGQPIRSVMVRGDCRHGLLWT